MSRITTIDGDRCDGFVTIDGKIKADGGNGAHEPSNGGIPVPECGASANMVYVSSSHIVANVLRGGVHVLRRPTVANVVINTQSVGNLRVAIYQSPMGEGGMSGQIWDLISDTAYTSAGAGASEEIALNGGPFTLLEGYIIILHGTTGTPANIAHWNPVIGTPFTTLPLPGKRGSVLRTTISSITAAPATIDPAGGSFVPSGVDGFSLGCYFT